MTIRISPALITACFIALGAGAAFAAPGISGARGLELIQYDRYGNQPPPGYGDNRSYDNRDRDRYGDDRDYRGPPHKWRPGEVVPPQLLGRVVFDWEDRGLSRPPGGHQWVRIGLQFVLVRESDRKIARILNFD